MKIKTQGKCQKCGEMCSPAKATTHLLKCTASSPVLSQPSTEGFLVRASDAGQPNLYWMYIAIPKDLSLGKLDQFLRNIWLECCGHLSEFTIGNRRYMSHTESGNPSQSMKNKMDQILSPGMILDYVYDMGSSTELELEVIDKLSTCPQKEIALLMRNDPPPFFCTSCKKPPEVICSMCGETTCADCSEDHSCAVDEGDTYMLMSLVNSPRSGVCGYEG
ncbi:MAG TPA: hypothetical protein VGJ00_07470 [Rhabdochlamydiaceae bacterium]|jgi:hypothetical protein